MSATKTAPKKSAKAAKAVEGTKPAPVQVETASKTASVRLRVFKLLAKTVGGMSNGDLNEKLGVNATMYVLKSECLRDKSPRLKRTFPEGSKGAVYEITAAGRKALEAGTVDSEAAPSAAGKEYPKGR